MTMKMNTMKSMKIRIFPIAIKCKKEETKTNGYHDQQEKNDDSLWLQTQEEQQRQHEEELQKKKTKLKNCKRKTNQCQLRLMKAMHVGNKIY